MAFNRDRNSRGGGFRPRFNDSPRYAGGAGRSSSRGPVEMHKAICDNCGKECEVPFRPTSGKPVFCSNCFENQRGGSDRPMFDATCADCGNSCKVPFQPSGDKPVFCSNCFGEKKNSGGNNGGKDERSSPASQDRFEELSTKLDKILSLLSPAVPTEEVDVEVVTEKPIKAVKKKTKVKETAPSFN